MAVFESTQFTKSLKAELRSSSYFIPLQLDTVKFSGNDGPGEQFTQFTQCHHKTIEYLNMFT